MAERLAGGARSSVGSIEAAARVFAFWTFVLVALGLIGGVVLSEPYAAARCAERRLDATRSETKHIVNGNERLRAEIDAIQTNTLYVERLIRSDLSWQRPGERVTRVQPVRRTAGSLPPPPPTRQRTRVDRLAERLAGDPLQRTVTLAAAGALFLVAFACFAGPRRRSSTDLPDT